MGRSTLVEPSGLPTLGNGEVAWHARRLVGHVVSFINYKGGVGKSTTTYHIGCALAYAHGKRVLLVDIDPQCSLTLLCMTVDRWKTNVRGRGASVVSLYEQYLNGKAPIFHNALWVSPVQDFLGKPLLPTLDLIPSDVDLLTDPDVAAMSSSMS